MIILDWRYEDRDLWLNFLNSLLTSDQNIVPDDVLEKELVCYNATLDSIIDENDTVSFKTEADLIFFKLRWY